jgi:2-polyprenyl-3-methyl-5-hydroxy-6-metoxy-1,4-benzoquinol methylase
MALEESARKCMLCGSNKSSLLQVGARHAQEAEVRRCAVCGVVFLSPQPRPNDLRLYYSTMYREDYCEPLVEQRHRNDLDEAYVRVQRLLPQLKPETRLLEVGSGSGAFLYAVRPYVKEVVGIEPDFTSRNWIKQTLGITVLEEISQDIPGRDSFDLVVCFHVLEHVSDPIGFLKGLKTVLKSGGELAVEVPNVDDVLVGVYDILLYRQFYYQKAHLYYFSKKTLALVLEKAGYNAIISGVQRYDLSNHIRWMLTGQPGGQGYYRDILSPSVQATYADSLISSGHSDTLWGLARRAS